MKMISETTRNYIIYIQNYRLIYIYILIFIYIYILFIYLSIYLFIYNWSIIPTDIIYMNTNWHIKLYKYYIEVSSNEGTSKSSILIGFSIMNHPLGGTPIYSYIYI